MVAPKAIGFTVNIRKYSNESREPRGLDPRILMALYRFFRRNQLTLVLRGICIVAVLFLVAFGLLATIDYIWIINDQYRFLGSGIAYLITLVAAAWWIGRPWLAREEIEITAAKFEQAEPNLRNHLLAAVELGDGQWDDDAPTAGSAQLRQILHSRVARYIPTVHIASLIPLRILRPWFTTAGLILLLVVILMLIPGSPVALLFARALAPTANLARASSTKITILQPNDPNLGVPANETMLVHASINGDRVTTARLEYRSEFQSKGEIPMISGTDSQTGNFTANLDVGEQRMEFRIFAGDALTAWQTVVPRHRPEIETVELTITPPAYALTETTTDVYHENTITVLLGSNVEMLATINQPVSSADIEILQEGTTATTPPREKEPLTRKTLTSMEYCFNTLKTATKFQIHLVASETGFDNKFPRKFAIDVVEDEAPIVKIGLGGQSSTLAPPRDLVPIYLEVRDELPIESMTLEYAINEEGWLAYPNQPSLQLKSDVQELRRFRALFATSTELDLAAVSLKEGDLLRLRYSAIDRKSQRSISNERSVLITSDYFTKDRYKFLNQRLTWLSSIDRWSTIKSEMGGAQVLLKEGVELLTQSPAGSESMEVESFTQASFSIDELETIAVDKVQQEKERIRTAATWFVAYSLGEVVARDADALAAFARRIYQRSKKESPAWNQRQLQLLQANYESCLKQYAMLSDAIPDSSRRAIRSLSDQWEDHAERIASVLRENADPRRVEAEQRFQWEQLRNQSENPLLDGGVCGNALDGLRNLHDSVKDHGKMIDAIAKILDSQRDLKRRRDTITDAAEASPIQEKLLQANAQFQVLVRNLDKQLLANHAIHAARVDVTPARLEDLDLIQGAVSSVLSRQVKKLEPTEAFRQIASATAVLDAGMQVIEMENLLRVLAVDERWNRDPIVMRLLNPKRWDYWGRGLELAVSDLRNAGLADQVINELDQLRYQNPAGIVGRVIGNRRWDKNWRNSASDNLEVLLATFRNRKLPVDQEMANAREVLRQLFPQEDGSKDTETTAQDFAASKNEPKAKRRGSLPLIDLQALLEASDSMSAEEMLRVLEGELMADKQMQQKLSDISDRIVQQAIAELERAAVEEYNSQRSLEQNDDAVREDHRMSVRQLQMLADEINQINSRLVQQARSAAARGAAKEAIDQFSKAEKLLQDANDAARDANESMLTQELTKRSVEVNELLTTASEALTAAEKFAAERTADELQQNPNRNRTRDQMRALQQRAGEQLARDAQQRAKQWEQLAKSYDGQIANAERRLREAEQKLKKAGELGQKQPEEHSFKSEARNANQAIAKAESQLQALKYVKEEANQLAEQAKRKSDEIKSVKQDALEANNPAAELAETFARQGISIVAGIREATGGIRDRLNERTGIRAEQNQLGATTQQQDEIQRQVRQVADSLARAARHERRLGSDLSVEALQQAAEAIRQVADKTIEAAKQLAEMQRQKLLDTEQLTTTPEEGRKVAAAVAETRQAIGQQLENLAGIATDRAEQTENGEQTPQGSGSQEQEMSQNKARALDDLDRALSLPQQSGENQQKPRAEAEEATNSQTSMSQSSTLAQLAAEQASAMARAQQAIPKEAVFAAASMAQSSGNLSPDGRMEGQPLPATSANQSEPTLVTSLQDWAELRERRSEDSSEGRRSAGPSKYRRQIEAYFRSISKKANQP